MRCTGIDVSYANGKFQWQKFQDDFAMVKATQGRSDYGSYSDRCIVDSQFARNVQGCKNYKIPFGVYHYLTAQTTSEATEEAKYFLTQTAAYGNDISLWYAVDVESCQLKMGKSALTSIVSTFCKIITAAGKSPMVYTSSSWLKWRLDLPENVPLWLALWTSEEKNALKYSPTIWQYGMDNDYGTDGNIGYFNLPNTEKSFEVGDVYTISADDKYTNGKSVPARYVGKEFTIGKVKEGAVFLPAIWSWVKV